MKAEKRGERNAPADEGEVGNRELATDEVLLLREDALEDGEDALHLLLVALDGVGNLVGRKHREVRCLSKVRSLTTRLEAAMSREINVSGWICWRKMEKKEEGERKNGKVAYKSHWRRGACSSIDLPTVNLRSVSSARCGAR